MSNPNKRHQQRGTRQHLRAASAPRWRIGNASVSTEELQAWQLGPARIEHWLEVPRRQAQA